MLMGIKNRLQVRKGMTLVELLVVMSIMVTFAAITAAFYPSISSDNQIAQTANKIQNILVGARQKARRDFNATGVRFFPDATNPNIANQMMLVQKPVDLTGLSLGASLHQPQLPTNPTIIQFSIPVWGFPTGEDLIMANDIYVEPVTNNSTPILSKGVLNTQMIIKSNFYSPNINPANPILNYKIIRRPRIVPGEEAIPMPDGYEILLGANFYGPKVNPSDSSIDVCFEKTGALYQIDFASNVYIWVHKTGSIKYIEDDAIIGVQRNNGKVAVFPVGPVDFSDPKLHDPFKYATNPTNEGL